MNERLLNPDDLRIKQMVLKNKNKTGLQKKQIGIQRK